MTSPKMQAAESRGVDQALAEVETARALVGHVVSMVESYAPIPHGGRVLDVGAAQGAALVAFEEAGFEAVGVEPWEQARETSRAVAARTGRSFEVVPGRAEALPFEDESFDFVHASSVIEHVDEPDRVYRDVWRVLRPGGGFFFSTTSSVCPRQSEIDGFPLFPWYPGPLKRAIMRWAVRERPSLVGFTEKPAYYWPTPWSLRRQLLAAGFERSYHRWELLRTDDKPGWKGAVVRAACANRVVRLAGDVVVQGQNCLAVKAGATRTSRFARSRGEVPVRSTSR